MAYDVGPLQCIFLFGGIAYCPFSVRVTLVPEPSAYTGMDEYTSLNSYLNKSVYARSLPPIPENCPLPMGVVGKKHVDMNVQHSRNTIDIIAIFKMLKNPIHDKNNGMYFKIYPHIEVILLVRLK